MTFANPTALWCLLGIPAVLAVHYLQRRSRRETVTTLFLLQQMQRESETGNRIERLRPSIPLWLQLLMVLLFTWLLVGPRWPKKDAVQRIALVMDSSASMQAFRGAAEQGVRDALAALLTGPLARAELTLLSSDAEAATLYHGASSQDMLAALQAWQPVLGVHDFTPALRTARSLVGEKGAVLLITDHTQAARPPFDARVLSVGQETANVGWAGVTVEEKDGQWLWRALLRNHSRTPQDREWRAESGGKVSAWTKLTLGPGETRTLSGPFLNEAKEDANISRTVPRTVVPASAGSSHSAANTAKITLSLSPDAFTPDDQLPLLRPQPKLIGLHMAAEQPGAQTPVTSELTELFQRFDGTRSVAAASADVRIIVWPPSVALPENQHACIFASRSQAENPPYLRGSIVGEAHPLTDGLNWQSLLVREGMVMPRDPRDRVLLWQGERSLISLRVTPAGARQLFCHFDLATSNARKLPALAILLHRFLEEVRREKIAPETANYDLRQRLSVAHAAGDKAAPLTVITHTPEGTSTVPLTQAHLLRAPARPGFFEVKQADTLLLSGAAHFADTREADLSAATPFNELADLTATQIETTHETDPNWRLWSLVLLAALLGSWWWGSSAKATRQVAAVHLANPSISRPG